MRRGARPYVAVGKLPPDLKQPRNWRTRPDPFEEHWPEIEARLQVMPELEAKTLFELLQQQYPGRYEDGKLRTLHRHVKRWRANHHGPDREIVLAQQHRSGKGGADRLHARDPGPPAGRCDDARHGGTECACTDRAPVRPGRPRSR